MPDPSRGDVAEALATLTGGDDAAAAALMERVYDELRALAGSFLRGQRGGQSLQPTALVHEAFVRVTDRTGAQFQDRAHFFAISAVAMRRILTDHARRRGAAKRGGGWQRITLSELPTPGGGAQIDAMELDEALTELAARSERQARIVEYRFFSGMTVGEVARVLDVSLSTVEEEWRMARAWLKVRLRRGQPT